MREYRVTKFDPRYRNEYGHFIRDDWTSYGDVGKVCNGILVTYENYLKIESQYVNTVVGVMNGIKMDEISLVGHERRHVKYNDKKATKEMKKLNRSLIKRNAVYISEVPDLCRLILRGCTWVKMESRKMFVHFGYDYYMYIGLEEQYEHVMGEVKNSGLFFEEMESPYK